MMGQIIVLVITFYSLKLPWPGHSEGTFSLWFDPTGNRTQVYCFSSRHSIHLTTDRLISNNIVPMYRSTGSLLVAIRFRVN